jgi:NADH:ubiquinone oxidoreductase subunit 5 (subunit L)/multisubunit Na+/H+ antiporter MnhA subunit
MAIGDIIVNLSHMQDIRFLSSGKLLTPASRAYIGVSSLNLMGLPMIRGFFSKDLVLETLSFSQARRFLVCVIYLNVILTFFYTLQLTFFNLQTPKATPFYLTHSFSSLHSLLILFLAVLRVVFGSIFLDCLSNSVTFQSVAFDVKVLPTALLVVIVLLLLVLGSQVQIFSKIAFYIFSSIALLRYVCMPVSSKAMLQARVRVIKVSETGLFRFALNKSLSSQLAFTAVAVSSHIVSSPLKLALLSTLVVMVSLVF